LPEERLVTLEVAGAAYDEHQLVRDFDRLQRAIQDNLNMMMRRLAAEAEAVYQFAAPVDTGELRDTIRAIISFRAQRIRIEVGAHALRGDFDYLEVSRFGHITPKIVPRRAKRLTAHVFGRHQPPLLMRSVKGYRAVTDWVADGTVAAQTLVDTEQRLLSREIDVSMLHFARGR